MAGSEGSGRPLVMASLLRERERERERPRGLARAGPSRAPSILASLVIMNRSAAAREICDLQPQWLWVVLSSPPRSAFVCACRCRARKLWRRQQAIDVVVFHCDDLRPC